MGGRQAWDATVIDTLAESYRARSAEAAGAAAEIAEERKPAKYTTIQGRLSLYPGGASAPPPKLGGKVFWVLGGEELTI